MSRVVGKVVYSEQRRVSVEPDTMCSICIVEEAKHNHHILPYSEGYRTVISVCEICHNKIHGTRFANHSELIKSGIKRAKNRGIKVGRKKDIIDIKKLTELWLNGMTYSQISRELNTSPATICRTLKEIYPKPAAKKL